MVTLDLDGRLKRQVDEFERRLIVAALAAAGWNQRTAARSLGALPTTLNAKIKRLGIPSRPGAPVELPEPSPPEPNAREEFVWEGALDTGRTLEIEGVTGSFRAEVAPTESVRVVATKHGPAALRRQIAITVTSSRRGVLVRVRTARQEAGEGFAAPLTPVDVAVQVPLGVRLVVHRADGHLDLAGITGTIHVPAAAPPPTTSQAIPLRRRA
jgi:regulatory Fis family protein